MSGAFGPAGLGKQRQFCKIISEEAHVASLSGLFVPWPSALPLSRVALGAMICQSAGTDICHLLFRWPWARTRGRAVVGNARPAERSGSDGRRRRCEREVFVHRPHRGRTLADRGGDALRRSRPHVAHREEARVARLVRKRHDRAPPAVVQLLGVERAVGEDEAVLVEGGAADEPVGLGIGTDEGEQGGARARRSLRRPVDLHRAQDARHRRAPRSGCRRHVDLRMALQPV